QILPDKSVRVRQGTEEILLKAPSVLIATGSVPASLPGWEIDHQNILDSTDALSLSEVPKKLAVIGGGYIGLELGSVYLRRGSEVRVLEALDRIAAGLDQEVGRAYQKILQRQGMKFYLSTKVKGVQAKGRDVEISMEGPDGKGAFLVADKV